MVSVATQTPQLRPYQTESIYGGSGFLGIRGAWRVSKSTLLVLPTGCGKSVVLSEVARLRRDHGARRTLVVVHRKSLVTQLAGSLERAGLSVEIEMGDRRASVGGNMWGQTSDVVVASMQSLQGRRLRAFERDAFDTLIIDEAHRAICRSHRNILEWFADALVLGVTATPDRGDGVGLRHVFETVAYEYEMRDAIKAGWLAPLVCKQIHCADLDMSRVRSSKGDLMDSDLEQALTVDAVLHQMADPIVREAGDRKTIVFTAGVAQAHALAQVMCGYTDASKVMALDGTTPDDVQEAAVNDFVGGDLQYLINCDLFTEGFDAPPTACVALCRPTKSRAALAQRIGRGTRLAPGKQDCLILDFTGSSGQHRLVNPADVLAGKDLPDDVREEIAERLASEGVVDVEAALEMAEERAKERLAKLEEEKRRQRVRAEVTYMAEEVDPFGGVVVTCGSEKGPRATASQLRALEKWGVKPPKTPSRGEASRILDKLVDRKKQGLCTFKQARALAKAGINPDATFEQAKEAMDRLMSSGWSNQTKREMREWLGSSKA